MSQSSIFAQTGLIVMAAVLLAAAAVYALLRHRINFRARIDAQFGKVPAGTESDTLRQLDNVWRAMQSHAPAVHCIDDVTWNDLDMDKVFSRINACHTSVGEETLHALLHTPFFSEAPLKQFEAVLEELDANPSKRLDLQVNLSKMGRSPASGLYSFGSDAKSKRLKYPFVYTALACVPLLCIALLFVSWQATLFAIALSFMVNIAVYSLTKLYIARELAALRYFSTLLWCAKKICRLGISPGITAELSDCLRIFQKIAGKISSITRDKLSDADMLAEYLKIPFLSDIRSYSKAIRLIEQNTGAFLTLYGRVGILDTAVSVLSFRKSLPQWCRPEFAGERAIEAQGVYHPLLDTPVCNDAVITRSCLVSGSNASGKSTFIKALAVNGILAQTIHTCAAGAYRTHFTLVISSMAVRDDIAAGESYFITEIKSLRRILDAVQNVACVCYIDEILKGTNTVERIAASAAVLNHLCAQPCLCIAATHDIELTRMLEGRFDSFHFEEKITDQGMAFDYKLMSGPSRTRNAIALLDYMKYDTRIIEEAQRQVKHFEQTGSWNAPR